MSQLRKRRNIGAMLALALLLLVSGLSFGARSWSTVATTTGSPKQMAAAQTGKVGAVPAAGVSNSTANNAKAIVTQAERFDTSPPLSSIPPVITKGQQESEVENRMHSNLRQPDFLTVDPVVQNKFGPFAMPTPIQNFEGVNNRNGVYPPDTNGDVSPNHYVQTVNLSFQVFTRTGTSVYGPANLNTLWAGLGGFCQTQNDGDPIVMYDHLADRWFISQFAISQNGYSGPYYQCIAVSATSDPTGSWHRYAFQTSTTKLNDYPHFGLWPDAYYMTANLFNYNGGNFDWAGTGAYAFDRTTMLAGGAATMQKFELGPDDWGGMLPSDLDGDTLPPAGAPNTFVEVTADEWSFPPYTYVDELQVRQFHVDWVTPANSTFSSAVHLPVAAFDGIICGANRERCINQPGTAVRLEALDDRLMWRLAYRNFGTHESLVVNHTVDAGSSIAGIRWYELRSPRSSPTIYQQGTFAPDASHRWTGSLAMDQDGNMALGYSVSSSSIYPSIRYTGRLAGDPLGQMTQGEETLINGTGSQTGSEARWGDYSSMMLDPVDDCTFWYTNEYLQTTGGAPWRTRIGSFKFPSCGAPAATPTRTSTPQPTRTATVTATGTPSTATPTATACPMTFTDVHPTDYFYVPVRYLYCMGAISGYADNTFRPFNNTTRGQLTKIVVLGMAIPVYTPPTPTFSDVPTNHPFYQYIETAVHEGIVSGYADGTFKPQNNVTRGQLSKIVVEAAGWPLINPPTPSFSDVPTNHPFYQYIETAFDHGIISGYADGTFKPGNDATRGQIAKIVYNAIAGP